MLSEGLHHAQRRAIPAVSAIQQLEFDSLTHLRVMARKPCEQAKQIAQAYLHQIRVLGMQEPQSRASLWTACYLLAIVRLIGTTNQLAVKAVHAHARTFRPTKGSIVLTLNFTFPKIVSLVVLQVVASSKQ